mgnify:CR=1 FL=1
MGKLKHAYQQSGQRLANFFRAAETLAKVLLASKQRIALPRATTQKPLLVCGNGPSLKTLLANDDFRWEEWEVFVVNSFVLSPHFTRIRPRHYLILDDIFYAPEPGPDAPPDFREAWLRGKTALQQLQEKVTWPLTLHFPWQGRRGPAFRQLLAANPNISVAWVNNVVIRGWRGFRYGLYRRQWGVPRSGNVMNAAVYRALHLGHTQVVLHGLDFDLFKQVQVGPDNRLYWKYQHFYDADDPNPKAEKPQPVSRSLTQVLEEVVSSLRTFHELQAYATHRGQQVYNATPQSMVDAFPRKPLEAFQASATTS